MAAKQLFEVAQAGCTLIVTPRSNLMSLDRQELLDELEAIHRRLQSGSVVHLIIDFEKVPYFGSAMLGAIQSLSRFLQEGRGKLLFCNLAELPRDVLRIARFDRLGTICQTRQEALDSVAGEATR